MEKHLFKIAQITDSHILENKGDLLHNINTLTNLNKIVRYIGDHDFDAILFTGDLSENGSLESYELINHELSILNKPIYCIPGNHDILANMQVKLRYPGIILGAPQLIHSNWEFIFLNTPVPHESYGWLDQQNLNFLQNRLSESSAQHIALVMHHHPISLHDIKFDKYMVRNADKLYATLTGKVKLILCGHVHGDYSYLAHQVAHEASPATSFQFAIGADNSIEVVPKSGFKEYTFYPDHYAARCIWI